MKRLSFRILIWVLVNTMACDVGLAQADIDIQLYSGKFLKDVKLVKLAPGRIVYSKGQSLHDLTPNDVLCLKTDSSFYMMRNDGVFVRASVYEAKFRSDSVFSSFSVYDYKLSNSEAKLLKNRSHAKKFITIGGQYVLAAPIAIAGGGAGALAGFLASLYLQDHISHDNHTIPLTLVGLSAGYIGGTVFGVSTAGHTAYGHNSMIETTVGAVAGLGLGAGLIALDYNSETGMSGFSIPVAMVLPIVGGIVGYYKGDRDKRHTFLRSTLTTTGNSAKLTLTF